MHLNHDELMLLSRGGRVPRAERPRPVMVLRDQVGPGRVATLVHGLRTRSRRRHELDVHSYLELEFAVEDEPQAGLSPR